MKFLWLALGVAFLLMFFIGGIGRHDWDISHLNIGCLSLIVADTMHERDVLREQLRAWRREFHR